MSMTTMEFPRISMKDWSALVLKAATLTNSLRAYTIGKGSEQLKFGSHCCQISNLSLFRS